MAWWVLLVRRRSDSSSLYVISVTRMMTNIAQTRVEPRWLLFIFALPTKRASRRVDTWRKLRRYGALALKSGGHVLPNTASNRERFEWLGARIRKHAGHGPGL